jgi:hypothetical protein
MLLFFSRPLICLLLAELIAGTIPVITNTEGNNWYLTPNEPEPEMDPTSYTAHPGESSNLGASPPPLLPPCPEPLLPSVGGDDESVWSYTENEDEENPSPPPDTNEDALLGNNIDDGLEDDLLCYPEEDEVEKFVTVKPEETLDMDMDRVVKEEDIETEIPVPMAVSDDMKLRMDKMGRRFRMSYSSYSLAVFTSFSPF